MARSPQGIAIAGVTLVEAGVLGESAPKDGGGVGEPLERTTEAMVGDGGDGGQEMGRGMGGGDVAGYVDNATRWSDTMPPIG